MCASLTAPVVDGEDIANYGTVTGTDKWWNSSKTSGRPKGQTFTTGDEVVWLTALTYQISSNQKAEPTKTYVIRVGTVYGETFREIYFETATQTFTWNASEFMTWTFDVPVLLAPHTTYGIDVGMTLSTSAWQTGIPYLNRTGDDYAQGTRYMSGDTGRGLGDATLNNMSGDMLFHLDLTLADPHMPGYAVPANGATVTGGQVELTWTNVHANVGSDVYVDVWFGSDPATAFTKVLDAGRNSTSVTVNAPADGRYYWQVNSYVDGRPSGVAVDGTVFTFYVDDASENELVAALTRLKQHIVQNPALDSTDIAAHKATIDAHWALFERRQRVIAAGLDLIATYDTKMGPLFVSGSPVRSFKRSNSADSDINWVIYNVMQHIMDHTYTSANISRYHDLLDGFKFGSADFFPGPADPPVDPEAIYTVSVDGSYPDTWGRDTMYTRSPARRPTGAYLAPGSIATVAVPAALVDQGYRVRVCAHSWDFSNKPTIKRLDRSSLVYLIDSTQVKVASPLGGGLYIEVPYLADAGVVSIEIKNSIRSPFFSAKPFHATTLEQWQDTERHHPAPWADFQTERFMMNVPTDWIYEFDDPVTLMQDWDKAVDAMNDLMGYPSQGKEAMYPQIDLYLRASVLAPGYPSVNSKFNPNTSYGGNRNHYLLKGPQHAPDYLFHEEGHGYLFQKFPGETESNVNLLHVAVWHQAFGIDLDHAFAASRGYQGNAHRTLDKTAVTWMTVFNFSPREVPMASGEKAYQLKGHAKFVDIVRLFGWQVLNDYWYSFNEDHENRTPIDTSTDGLILRLSKCARVDLRPLLHFWGIHPKDPGALAQAIATQGLVPSQTIYDALVRYKSLVPADNAAFQTFALNWWGHKPSINGYWTEREHTRQWDHTSYWQSKGWDYAGTDVRQADGEIYTEATCARIKAVIDELLAHYFPDVIDAPAQRR